MKTQGNLSVSWYKLLMSLAVISIIFCQTVTAGSVYDGYTLFAPLESTTTYLIDIEGNVAKTWESSYTPGASAYILDDHSLLRTASLNNSSFDTGGLGGGVEKYDWDGNLTWSYTYSSDTYCTHHDVEELPNGNLLMIAWELKTEDEAIVAGRDPSLISDGELWPDHIIEVQPDSASGGTIVWEWHAWDHLIQDYDSSKNNYGTVVDHPELIDLNYVNGEGDADWTHTNSVAYNEEYDQIVLSIHNFSEIWIIDHSTTTAEAASHSGGKYGKGGDLLYRWGNPQTYGAGTSDDQKLFGQHDAYWIPAGYPGENDILIFNNGLKRPGGEYSSVEQITPPVNLDGSYSLTSGSAYGPESATWTYNCSFFAFFISGAQRLPNGNTLICDGPDGYFVEIDSEGNTLWEYTNPYPETSSPSQVFRCYRYSSEYLGLSDGSDSNQTYPIIDTNQSNCFNNQEVITAPAIGEDFYGQDAQFDNNQPSYSKSEDGLTVYDNNTGLTWTQSADLNGDGTINYDDKLTFIEAQAYPDTLNAAKFGGYDDWRLPTIKELFSLMDFSGVDPSRYSGTDTSGMLPFIDADYFDFGYGNLESDERIIDAQFVSSTESVSPIIDGRDGMFGLNLADGRIKGYPTDTFGSTDSQKKFYVYFVRGNNSYGNNSFTDNGDGTITDNATGLMWSQNDSGEGLNWEEALAWVQTKNAENYLEYNDWRLPNGKELHSIVDYSRSPDTTNSAAIDPVFNCTSIINEEGESDYPYFWSGTTHKEYVKDGDTSSGHYAVYIAFGRGLGYFDGSWQDVHGAGCQRAEVKNGDPADYPEGYGPQGDAVRIYNYVRMVRDAPSDSQNPVPDIEANGSDGPLTVSQGEILTITISLEPGSSEGKDADWWVAAYCELSGWWSYVQSQGWNKGIIPYAQMPLTLLSSTVVLDDALPADNYTFYFAVDDNADGNLDAKWLDSVQVEIIINPVPDIEANGSDGPLTVSQREILTITISLEPGSSEGKDADWWVAAYCELSGWWSYVQSQGWNKGIIPYAQMPLTLLSSTVVLDDALPADNYTFYFAVDDNADGNLDAKWLDGVEVEITTP